MGSLPMKSEENQKLKEQEEQQIWLKGIKSFLKMEDKKAENEDPFEQFRHFDDVPREPSLSFGVDPEVVWKLYRNPYWDLEFMHGGRGRDLVDDEEVVWTDDAWNLRDIKEVPKS